MKKYILFMATVLVAASSSYSQTISPQLDNGYRRPLTASNSDSLYKMVGYGCNMYTESNFKGMAIALVANQIADLRTVVINNRWEDLSQQISSVTVGKGCVLQMWQYQELKGRRDDYLVSVPQLPAGADDYHISARCLCN